MKLSNPLRTKAIAEARIKTDRIDAKTLAYLLRGDLVAESYVPTRKNRERRALIRHRASLMQMRVDIKNRIHALLDKHELTHTYTDLFGKQGLEWLQNLHTPNPRPGNPPIQPTSRRNIEPANSNAWTFKSPKTPQPKTKPSFS